MSDTHGNRGGVSWSIAIVVGCLAVAAVAAGGVAAQQEGEFEPNDDTANATAVEPGSYTDLNVTEGDLDYYAVDLEEGDALSASIDFSNDRGDLELVLLSPDGVQLRASTSTDDSEAVSYVAGQSGTYYLVVYGFDGATGPYDLTVDRTPGEPTPADDETEPNDGIENATATEPGNYTDLTVTEGDLDYYAVDLEAGDAMSASIDFSNDRGDLDFALLSPNGSVLLVNDSVSDNERLSYVASESGTYYLVVFGFDGATGPYDLSVAVTSASEGTQAWLE